jgi:hypothetical protein
MRRINMNRIITSAVAFAVLSAVAYGASDTWVAYNDCVHEAGQFIADNVTTYAIGRTNPHPESGELIRVADGGSTGVTATFVEFKTAGSLNWAKDAATFDEGSDAAELFGEYVDPSGNISYGDAPGWYLDLIIEGLDPDGSYTFAGTVNRNGGADYEDRISNWRIMSADFFTYASSEDAHKVAEDTVEFSTGVNAEGLVAKWTNIDPGDDGEIVIRTTHGVGEEAGGIADAHANKGYAAGLFMLEFQGPQAVEAYGKLATTWGGIRAAR